MGRYWPGPVKKGSKKGHHLGPRGPEIWPTPRKTVFGMVLVVFAFLGVLKMTNFFGGPENFPLHC